MHASTFMYLKPTDEQMEKVNQLRGCFTAYGHELDALLPEGPDKTYIMRKLREIAMWANVSITRLPDGTPRT